MTTSYLVHIKFLKIYKPKWPKLSQFTYLWLCDETSFCIPIFVNFFHITIPLFLLSLSIEMFLINFQRTMVLGIINNK